MRWSMRGSSQLLSTVTKRQRNMIPFYYGLDLEYAQKRLTSTMVFLRDGSLFQIEEVHAKPATLVKPVHLIFSGHDGNEHKIVESNDLDMSPITLGYTVLEDYEYSTFMTRIPSRSGYKQGLAFSAILTSYGSRGHLKLKHVIMPAMNRYKPFKEVRDTVGSKKYEIPFSRHFALAPNKNLFYRGNNIVGKVNKQGDAVLEPRFSYLQQHLDTVTK